jgi:hypothetical protein
MADWIGATAHITTAISYPERRAAHRPRLRGDRDRRDRPLQAARRLRRLLPDRHRRARPEDAADRGREGITPQALADRNTPLFEKRWASAELLQRRLHPHHRAAPPRRLAGAIWRRMEANGDIYLGKYAGWYSVRDEAYYAESERDRGRADGEALAPQTGTPVEWVEEESYFFRLSAYQDRLLALYEAIRTSSGRPERRNEVVSFVKRRPAGPVDLAHHLRLGRAGARRRPPRHVCLGRRADQLHHRRRLPRRERRSWRFWPADSMSSARTSCASMPSTGRPS